MRTLLCTLIIFACFGADQNPDLPRSTVRVIDQHLRKLERAEKEYKETVEAANKDYVEDLEKEMTRATKDADLDAALWMRNEIERVKALKPEPEARRSRRQSRAPKKGSAEWLKAEAISAQKGWYCGRYGPYWFFPDGTAAYGAGKDPIGRWSIVDSSVVFSNTHVNGNEAFVYDPDKGALFFNGQPVTKGL